MMSSINDTGRFPYQSAMSVASSDPTAGSTQIVRPDILFIGSGNFSLPLTFVLKHMDEIRRSNSGPLADSRAKAFAARVIATEVKTREVCVADGDTEENIRALRGLGSQIRFQVDGTKLDETFPAGQLSRIQWDCPDVSQPYCDSRRKLPIEIHKTAEAASKILGEGGTFHITAITPLHTWKVAVGVHYELPGIEEFGFYLNEGAPRISGPDRYTRERVENRTQYSHKKSDGRGKVEVAEQGKMSEFVYVKHATQKTPARYMDVVDGYRQKSLGNRTSVDVDHGKYTYYCKPSGPPSSPKIQPPSFFDGDMFGLMPATTSRPLPNRTLEITTAPRRASLYPTTKESSSMRAAREMDDRLDDIDLSGLSTKGTRSLLGNMSRRVVRR